MRFLFDRATIFFYRPVGYRVAPSSVTCGDSFPPRGSRGMGGFWEESFKTVRVPKECGKNPLVCSVVSKDIQSIFLQRRNRS